MHILLLLERSFKKDGACGRHRNLENKKVI
jgi:hypothetical protein